jgi:UDP-N-acetylmuramoyl-L-alanyl-D-glutamate--2,6-diaminopimelate ligase
LSPHNVTRPESAVRTARLSALFPGAPDAEVSSLAYDSRHVEPGALFFCVPGFEADGHDFAEDAVRRGAAALVVERPLSLGVPEVAVPDARAAMASASARFYGDPSAELEVAGITGTNGKTTTAYLLREMLAASGRPCGMIGTVKTVVGDDERPGERTTPEAPELQRDLREMVEGGDRACAMEVSSVGLALHRVDAIHFAAAVFTNFSADHLDFHGSMDAYWAAKRSLFDRVPAERVAINVDDERGRALAAELSGSTTFGTEREADVRALDVRLDADGARFDIAFGRGEAAERVSVRSRLRGAYNVDNVLAAAATAQLMGATASEIAGAASATAPPPGRLERVDEGQPFAVVVDYAHSPDSVRRALDLLRAGTDGRLIAVFGATGRRFAATRREMGALAGARSDLLIASSDHPDKADAESLRDILRGAGDHAEAIEDRRDAIAHAVGRASRGDTVAILGGELPADDVATARAALRTRNEPPDPARP